MAGGVLGAAAAIKYIPKPWLRYFLILHHAGMKEAFESDVG